MVLTATATVETQEDIKDVLSLGKSGLDLYEIPESSVDRPTIKFRAQKSSSTEVILVPQSSLLTIPG